MRVIGEFTEDSRQEAMQVDGRAYVVTWESSTGFVEVPGISEIAVRIDDEGGNAVLYMRWMLVDIKTTGGKEGTLDALESHSPTGDGWATCLKANCEQCPPSLLEAGAIALLALVVAPPAYQGQGLGTVLAKAFAEQVLTRFGVRAFWLEPMPLVEHPATGIFKPLASSPESDLAKDRLEQHYEDSIDARPTCPNYLRVDLSLPENA